LRAAIREANKSNSPNFRVGAAAYRKGRIIAVGHNEFVKTAQGTLNRSRKIHAEFALSKTDLSGATILVVRLSGGGQVKMARPCVHCESILGNVKQVLYTDGHSRVVTMSGLVLGYVTISMQLESFIPVIRID
jgi:deoxycytidylate deaminase